MFGIYAMTMIAIGLFSGSIANQPITAAGAFIAAGLFGIADAIAERVKIKGNS